MRFMFGLRVVIAAVLVATTAAGHLSAQVATASLQGRITSADGLALSGAQVVVTDQETGSEFGTRSGEDGTYTVTGLRPGAYRIVARLIGYDVARAENVRLAAGQSRVFDLVLGAQPIMLDAMEIFATRAIERKTPVAYTDVDKTQLETQLGSQDLPIVLNVTPSVYATEGGGASGDSRINVRGFDQRNTNVMINGVPVNDMENGWVYWSNWDGLGDAASTIQLQRGLSAVNLATPSIGGTLNIITDATRMDAGGMLKQEFGNDGFLKTTGMVATGLLGNRFAFMAQGVRKTGDGIAQGLWTDAWAYYVGASFLASSRHRFDLFAVGAPQRHGQRLYMQNIGAFSADFARTLEDYDPAALQAYPESQFGFDYNENYNTVSPSYTGLQAAGSKTFERYDPNFLNERENFFHKPQVNLNWYSSLSDRLSLTTVAYYSGGRGGGTGTAGGAFAWDYNGPSRIADWDANIAFNRDTLDRRGNVKPAGESVGILRNSRNNQWTIGAISKLQWEVSWPLTVEVGLDWRTAEIDHYREVRDLLGGDYFVDTSNDFWTAAEQRRGLGDKIIYDFTNTVDWLGGYLQGEYSTTDFTVYGTGGLSTIKYTYTNHFRDDGTGNPLYSETDYIYGFQLKGGGLLNLTDVLGVYANAGYVSKVPIFDGVIDDIGGATNPNPQNEKFMAFEGGLDYRSLDRSIGGRLNLYYTQWNDRTITRGVITAAGEDALVSLLGLDALHMGVEAEVAFRLSNLLRLDLSAAVGNWEYTDDVTGTYRPDDRTTDVETFTFYVRDLKVGDAPQLQASAAVSVFPYEGVTAQLVGKTFGRHWAAFSPTDRTDPTDRAQSWRVPGYTVFDAHFSYSFPRVVRFLQRATVFAHVYNLLDEEYILDATDNSPFNGFDDDHDADDAEVYFGLPRRFNVGLQVNF